MILRLSNLTAVLIIGFYSFVFAPGDKPSLVLDEKLVEKELADMLKKVTAPDADLLIVNYCKLISPHQVIKLCESVAEKIFFAYPFAIIEKKDEEYTCQYTRISWKTTKYNNAQILPVIQCPELKVTKTDLSYQNMMTTYDSFERQHILGFANEYETYVFVSKSDKNPRTEKSPRKSNKKNNTEENSSRTPLLTGKSEGLGNGIRYNVDFRTLDNENDYIIKSIKSENVPVGDYKEAMMYSNALVRLNHAVFQEIKSIGIEAAEKDQAGPSPSVQQRSSD